MGESKSGIFKKRGGIWSVVGFLLVAGIIGMWAYRAYFDEEETPDTNTDAPRHVIVISIDTLRADHLGCYGYEPAKTPVMDGLAREGALFERHYTNYPLTLPAHLTQMTGVSSLGHRVRDNLYHTLPEQFTTLAMSLGDQGFQTGGFVSAYTLRHGSGIERGFQTYDDKGVTASERGSARVTERKAPDTLKRAGDWIESNQDGRVFAFIHLFDPHAPYEPHPDLGTESKDDTVARYDGEIAYTDRALGVFFERLKKLGMYDNALIVITSDHGEGLGDHSELTHGYFCYDTTTHVPLIIKGAGVGGVRVPGVVRNYDLAPTIMDVLGINDKRMTKQFHGVSLTPVMKDPKKDLGLSAFIESHYAYLNCHWAKIRGLRTRDHLTLFAGDSVGHFGDDKQDRNISAQNNKGVQSARQEIVRLMNSWVPPVGDASGVRETNVATPYPGEAPTLQDFAPENLNDSKGLASPMSKADVLRRYQDAELDFDEGRFATCRKKLNDLLHDDFELVIAHRLLAALNQKEVLTDWEVLGDTSRHRLLLIAFDALEESIKLSDGVHADTAITVARRNQALVVAWLRAPELLKRLPNDVDDAQYRWMRALATYRVWMGSDRAEQATKDAAKALAEWAGDSPAKKHAQDDLKLMQQGKELRLAPWDPQ